MLSLSKTLSAAWEKTAHLHVENIPSSTLAFSVLETFPDVAKNWLVICPGPKEMDGFHADLEALSRSRKIPLHLFPAQDLLPHEHGRKSIERNGDRLDTLIQCQRKDASGIVLCTVQALMQKTLSRDALQRSTLELGADARVNRETLLAFLNEQNYSFSSEVEYKGEAAVRGGLIDLWSPNLPHPLRIEFFGDEIESLRFFDYQNQRSKEKIGHAWICAVPDAEADDHSDFNQPLLDFLPTETHVLWPDAAATTAHAERYQKSLIEIEQAERVCSFDELKSMIDQHPSWKQLQSGLGTTGNSKLPLESIEPMPSGISELFEVTALNTLREEYIQNLVKQSHDGRLIFYFSTPGMRDRFVENYQSLFPKEQKPEYRLGNLSEGFHDQSRNHIYIAESDIYGLRKLVKGRYLVPKKTRQAKDAIGARIQDWTDIQVDELVVHIEHGIGRYRGLSEIFFHGRQQEVMVVEYADEAKLYVPVSQSHLLSRYIGTGRKAPSLHRLGGRRWEREKENAEQAIADYAAKMLRTQAMRNTLPGHAFATDNAWQQEFEASFPYPETEDQFTAIAAVKKDMENKQPMDRLICGDVGYGKTEVAIRAAFKAVMDGKQVAILVPTTILAQQHYHNFVERMTAFPIRIDMLSRFRTQTQQNKIVERLREGQIDIIIGTHRLVQPDIEFADLGLVIIDEEQRFGVGHKEKLKDLKQLVDVLTLSATPIPRTLYMSLTGTKDMSTIQTPPQERQPIDTHVVIADDQIIRNAVLYEINREGQVFYLYNRVRTIEKHRKYLQELVPEARIAVAHGQMPERQLEDIIQQFIDGEFDVLLCTTIIESGVDIPNVNTILIDRADRFGMADLYQLRGRVGRYKNKAHAYLLLPRDGSIHAVAKERIRAIERNTALGAGFKLALRDLELRGAGNILGTTQSGHITTVGFDLYCQVLQSSIKQLRGEKPDPVIDVLMNIDFISLSTENADEEIAAVIPNDYIPDESLRLEIYRKLACISSATMLRQLKQEIKDRFGAAPRNMKRLFKLAEIRLAGFELGLQEIEVRQGQVRLQKQKNYLMQNHRFPRLEKETVDARLQEVLNIIKDFINHEGTKHTKGI